MIAADHLTKTFGRTAAAADVSLRLREGEVFGLVGRSGSGKTTLGLMLCGLLRPDAGRVYREDGEPLRAQMIFQDPQSSLDPRWPVGEQIAEPLAIARAPRAERRRRVEQVLAEVRLDPALCGRYPHELSGGQRQRVAIARAVVARPHLIVADEPTSMLDPPAAAGIVRLFKFLARAERAAFLFISHDLAQAAEACDRVGVMDAGRLVEVAAPDALLRSAQTSAARLLVDAAWARERALAAACRRAGTPS